MTWQRNDELSPYCIVLSGFDGVSVLFLLFLGGFYVRNFLGLRPLAGYASLKLYHVMSCFCMRNVSCAMIWLVRLCMLMMLGMPAFWAPARPQPRRLTWVARARQRPQKQQPKKNSPQASPETQMQQNTVNSSVLWLGSRARARRPENQREKARTAQHASQPQQKQSGQNNSPTLSAAVFGRIYSVL